MHELSIALSLAEVAGEAAAKAGARRVLAVRVRIGLLSGVAADALRFSYELATAGTLLEGSRLDIDELPVVVFCPDCQAERQLPGCRASAARCAGGSPASCARARSSSSPRSRSKRRTSPPHEPRCVYPRTLRFLP